MRLAAGILLAFVVACSSPGGGGGGGGTETSSLPLLDTAGTGFRIKLSSSLDLQAAAASTPAAAGATKTALSQGGYSAGGERIFTRGDEFVTVVAFSLSTDVDAGQFVAFERASLHPPAVVVYDDGQIPGAFGFDLAGGTRTGNRTVFCQGVWFAARTTAYAVTDCAGSPRYPDLVEALALKQYRQAAAG